GHTDDPTTASIEDPPLAVTFHHNLYQNVVQGAPRARWGHVHVFSNYYNMVQLPSDPTSSYAIASTDGATLRIEGNYFEQVAVPIVTFLDDNSNVTNGTVNDITVANLNAYAPTSSASANYVTTAYNTWKPPYQYAGSFDSAGTVPFVVTPCAGPGRVP